jgi:hypothetical protein
LGRMVGDALSSWAPIAYVIIHPAGAFAQRTGGDHSRLFQAGCPVPVAHRYGYLELINGACPLVDLVVTLHERTRT